MQFMNNEKINKILLRCFARDIRENASLNEVFGELLKDEDLCWHSISVAKVAVQAGIYLSFRGSDLESLALAGLFHDVGKLKIAPEILYKATPLTEAEMITIKKHPLDGYNMLKDSGVCSEVLDCVKYHHELLDGSGYAEGKDDISLLVQIITVADIISALTEQRCYHNALSVSAALKGVSKIKNINKGIVAVLKCSIYD